jgi:hypothetical protein
MNFNISLLFSVWRISNFLVFGEFSNLILFLISFLKSVFMI